MTLADPDFPSSEAFDQIVAAINATPESKKKFIKQADTIVQFEIKNKAGKTQTWWLDLKNSGEGGKGKSPKKAEIQLIVGDGDFANLVAGRANAQKLYMGGKLKAKGNIMKAAKLEGIFKAARSDVKL